jgi:hypothetical protein
MTCAGCSGFEPGTMQIFESVVRSSLPSGIWARENIGKHFLSLPTWFYPQAWSLSGVNVVSLKPTARLLHEIITRRTLAAGYTHTDTPCLSNYDHFNTMENLIYEEVPLNGWWAKGVSPQHRHTQEKNEKTNDEIKASKKDKITVKIKLPESESLFTVSGAEFISSKEVEKGSAEAEIILQSLFLEALHAIQKCGEGYLKSSFVDLKTFSGLKEDKDNSTQSPSSSSPFSSSSPLSPIVELGEDSCDDSTEIASKMKTDVYFISFSVRPVRAKQIEIMEQKDDQNDINHKMDIYSTTENTSEIPESSPRSTISKCVRDEKCFEEGSNLKKTRIESTGVSGTVNRTENKITHEFSGNSAKIGRNAFLCEENMVRRNEMELNSSSSVYDPTGTGDRTVRAYTGMGMLPIDLEEKLTQAIIGSNLEFSFSSHIQSPWSLASPFPTPSPTLTPSPATVSATVSSEMGMIGKFPLMNKSKREREERVHTFEIIILERSKCDDQPVNKKARPHLFYPSLAVQVRRTVLRECLGRSDCCLVFILSF